MAASRSHAAAGRALELGRALRLGLALLLGLALRLGLAPPLELGLALRLGLALASRLGLALRLGRALPRGWGWRACPNGCGAALGRGFCPEGDVGCFCRLGWSGAACDVPLSPASALEKRP